MLRHVVSWRIATEDTAEKLEHSAAIAASLQGLVPDIPQIISLTVGSNASTVDGNWDLVLIADFDDEAALTVYIDHPRHQEAVAVITPLVASRAVVDFLI